MYNAKGHLEIKRLPFSIKDLLLSVIKKEER